MARKKKNIDENEGKNWKEGELIKTFKLHRITKNPTPLMQEWFEVEKPIFNAFEQVLFDKCYEQGLEKMATWSEEDLKMKFITHILDLGHLYDEGEIVGYFDKLLSAVVEGTKLTVKSDFMIAKGILNIHENPYFHFQEYKPQLNPSGEPMAQLLEAFLIGQVKNDISKPLYGVEIIGKQWTFVTMEGKDYCISKSFFATEKNDLLKIIAILRKFKHILMTRLLN